MKQEGKKIKTKSYWLYSTHQKYNKQTNKQKTWYIKHAKGESEDKPGIPWSKKELSEWNTPKALRSTINKSDFMKQKELCPLDTAARYRMG